MKNNKVLFLTQFSILVALEAIVCFTPLGSLPVGPIVATLALIPVIITAVTLGTWAGTAMGAIAGLFSFFVWTFTPPSPAAFLFTPFYSVGEVQGNFGSLLICFVPRIFVGTVSGALFNGLTKVIPDKDYLNATICAIAGTLTNTIGVMGGIWIFFGSQYESMLGQTMIAIIGTTLVTNGVLEVIAAALVTPPICIPLRKMLTKGR